MKPDRSALLFLLTFISFAGAISATAFAETADSGNITDHAQQYVEEMLESLSTEQKVGQLFVVTPEQLTNVDQVTQAGETTRTAIEQYAVGGLIYMSQNLTDPEQTREMLANTKEIYSTLRLPSPLLCVDEEGGSVTRIAGNSAFDVTQFPGMREIGASGDISLAENAGTVIGSYLKDLGFNTDFAPVADVLTNGQNTVVADRSFGSDAELVTQMVRAESEALLVQGINPCLKHFPGHGATAQDTHDGYAVTEKTLEELKEAELKPFSDGVSYAPMIMVGHISLPNVTGDNLPASLSRAIITDLLRSQLGYDGVVITDAMNMGAIMQQYSSGEAAVMAIEAGNDLILMPQDFQAARQGLLDALESGRLSMERLDTSVRRILKLKIEMQHRAGSQNVLQ